MSICVLTSHETLKFVLIIMEPNSKNFNTYFALIVTKRNFKKFQ